MSAVVQRSVDDIDVWTRAFAEEQAKRAGVPVRVWLNQFITQNGAARGDCPSTDRRQVLPVDGRDGPAESRHTAWIGGDSASAEPLACWGPPREAFGHRDSRPDASQAPAGVQASAAAILANGLDDEDATDMPVAPRLEGRATGSNAPGELGVRARVGPTRSPLGRPLGADEIAHLLNGAVAQTEAPPEIEGVLAVAQALREMREQMEAAPQAVESRSRLSPSVGDPPGTAAWGQASVEAIAQLGADVARLVEVVDCGFDKIEATSAKLTVELRSEVAQMLDELAARIEDVEQRYKGSAADMATTPSPAGGQRDLDVASVAPTAPLALSAPDLATPPETVVDGEPPPTLAADDPDTDLFEDTRGSAGADARPRFGPADEDGAEPLAWPLSAPPHPPAIQIADHPLAGPAPHDPDSELFDLPPQPAAADARHPFADVDGECAEPLAWPLSASAPLSETEISAQDLAAPPARDVDWDSLDETAPQFAGAGSHDRPDAPASVGSRDWPMPGSTAHGEGWRATDGWARAIGATSKLEHAPEAAGAAPREPDREMTSVSGLDPSEQAAEQAANLPRDRGKRLGFPWLRYGRSGQARKSA